MDHFKTIVFDTVTVLCLRLLITRCSKLTYWSLKWLLNSAPQNIIFLLSIYYLPVLNNDLLITTLYRQIDTHGWRHCQRLWWSVYEAIELKLNLLAFFHMLHLIFTSVVNSKIPPRNYSYLNLLDYSLTFVHHNVSVYSVILLMLCFLCNG